MTGYHWSCLGVVGLDQSQIVSYINNGCLNACCDEYNEVDDLFFTNLGQQTQGRQRKNFRGRSGTCSSNADH